MKRIITIILIFLITQQVWGQNYPYQEEYPGDAGTGNKTPVNNQIEVPQDID